MTILFGDELFPREVPIEEVNDFPYHYLQVNNYLILFKERNKKYDDLVEFTANQGFIYREGKVNSKEELEQLLN